jgi:hydrogenase nickel incorporation protein HypA/HybF
MHELSVTESILDIATRHATSANAARITDVYLVIGDLSSIVDDSVQFYWGMISAGTLAENSLLHIQRIQARIRCQACGNEFTLQGRLEPCPACGGLALDVLAGEEFYVDSIEVESKVETG